MTYASFRPSLHRPPGWATAPQARACHDLEQPPIAAARVLALSVIHRDDAGLLDDAYAGLESADRNRHLYAVDHDRHEIFNVKVAVPVQIEGRHTQTSTAQGVELHQP